MKMINCGVTPTHITHLASNEVLVFGSNLQGHHSGGASRMALERFGAVWGLGSGIQGQSYAIPTTHGPARSVWPYVRQWLQYVAEHPCHHFYVTPIGCGAAGFSPAEIAPMFARAASFENVSLPESFLKIIITQAQ